MSSTNETYSSDKVQAEIAKLIAEAGKIHAENAKITRETFWYPVAIAAVFIGTIIAFTKAFL